MRADPTANSRSGQRPRKRVRRNPHPLQFPFISESNDTGVIAQRAFSWLLHPLPVAKFFEDVFEKKPVLLRGSERDCARFSSFLSVRELRDLVESRRLQYGKHVDVTRYTVQLGREDFNLESGSSVGKEAWKLFEKEACSIRLPRPQEHIESLWALCSTLETFFGSVVGCNVYATPPNSQGFAPHFDDIDAFVCQVSGTKHWKVYGPREDGLDRLPRQSSIDFAQTDVDGLKVMIDEVLRPGDMLYLPRGAIHQAKCPAPDGASSSEHMSDDPSLHVTVSACQRMTWADLLLQTFSQAVNSAASERVTLRRTLPLRFSDYAGISCGDADSGRKRRFDKGLQSALHALAQRYPIDAASDVMAEQFMRDRLPPWLSVSREPSLKCSVGINTRVRLAGRGVARVVMDEAGELPRLLHCLKNSRAARTRAFSGDATADGNAISCTPEEAFAIDFVIRAYPETVVPDELPLDRPEDRVDLIECLVDAEIFTIVP